MKSGFENVISYMGLNKIPMGLSEAYKIYEQDNSTVLIERKYYEELLAPYELSEDKKAFLDETLDAIEADKRVLEFSKFFVWDMCSVRNKYDIDIYTELVPSCLGKYNEAYAFIILLACVPVAEKEMIRRGIPKDYYKDIPHRMLRDQMERYKNTGRIDVEDMPWKMNFYTLQIFLLDRFLFIPYIHGESFTMYRSKKTGKVVAFNDPDCIYDSEGQLKRWGGIDYGEEQEEEIADTEDNGYEYGRREAPEKADFTTTLTKEGNILTGQYMNPCGMTENRLVSIDLDEYEKVLDKGDYLIALHIPGGEGYTPERMHSSMKLALEFYEKYYPELDMKGFWSSSWLYDERLEPIIGKNRNITNVQKLMFRYSDGEDGEMLYVHLYGDVKTKLSTFECRTSLQKGAKEKLLSGERFMTTGMMILKEEALSGEVYYTSEDEDAFFEAIKVH